MLLESSALKWRISQTQFICLERISIFLDLDCPASVWLSSLGLRPQLDNCQTLAGSPDLGKWKFPLGKSISSFRFSTSEQLLSSSMELLFSIDSPNILMCKQITEFFNDFNILHEDYFQIFGFIKLLLNLSVFFALWESKGIVTRP